MFSRLSSQLSAAISQQFAIAQSNIIWEQPQRPEHGDIASPIALQLAKQVGAPPREVAQKLVEALEGDTDIQAIDVAGPGYINIVLTPAALLVELEDSMKYTLPQAIRDTEAPVIVEYSSINIAKPLGIHHILTTSIGQVIHNLYRYQGFNTIAINHIGDWGTQFGKLFIAQQKFGNKPVAECTIDDLLQLYVQFHEEAETNTSLEDEARNAFKKLEDGDSEVQDFWQATVDITMSEVQKTYDQLHISFDYIQGESFYEDKMAPIIKEGKETGVFVEGRDGALIAEFGEDSPLPPAIVVKGDGATIYMTRDLATARYRLDTWKPQKILHVVGADQQLYFQQLIAIIDQLGWSNPLEHVLFGRMNFAGGGMSTRKGKIIKLQDVLDEAVKRATDIIASHGDRIQTDDPSALAEMMGQGAVVYGALSQNRKMDFTFDLDASLSFEGNSAPYLQYTHARARSILRKAEFTAPTSPPNTDELSQKERALIATLSRWDHVITQARESHMPHLLCTYLYSLCQEFNSFYGVEPILEASEPQRALRLTLTIYTANLLKTGAELLTISVPDTM